MNTSFLSRSVCTRLLQLAHCAHERDVVPEVGTDNNRDLMCITANENLRPPIEIFTEGGVWQIA